MKPTVAVLPGPLPKFLFLLFAGLSLVPGVTPAVALFVGIAFALALGPVYPKQAKKASKFLLQASVVGLGFGMDLMRSLQSGRNGMLFTIASVVLVMGVGWAMGRWLKADSKTSYLISAGTAICGGSAIAAVAPVIEADDDQISVSLGTVFVLNALALFLFPPLGHWIGLTETQFGEWAAIAIHDTSSVVGAGATYGQQALQTATLIKCTRALWIIPLALGTSACFRKGRGGRIAVPWFILLFVLAMALNSSLPLPEAWTKGIVWGAKKGLTLTLFLIGSGLSASALRKVGVKPLVQGVVLWFLIAAVSLAAILGLGR